MVLQNPELAVDLMLVLAVVVVLQSFFFVAIFILLNRQIKILDQKVSSLLGKAAAHVPTARSLLEKTVSLLETLPAVQEQSVSSLRFAAEQIRKGDEIFGRNLNLLRFRFERIDGHADQVFDKYSQKSAAVHQTLVQPIHTVSAILRAVRVATRHLANRR